MLVGNATVWRAWVYGEECCKEERDGGRRVRGRSGQPCLCRMPFIDETKQTSAFLEHVYSTLAPPSPRQWAASSSRSVLHTKHGQLQVLARPRPLPLALQFPQFPLEVVALTPQTRRLRPPLAEALAVGSQQERFPRRLRRPLPYVMHDPRDIAVVQVGAAIRLLLRIGGLGDGAWIGPGKSRERGGVQHR